MSEAEKMTKVERKAQKPGKAERGEDVILVIVGIFAAVWIGRILHVFLLFML